MSRLSEILGVKEGQEFKYHLNKVFTYKVKGNYLRCKEYLPEWGIVGSTLLCGIIANPELIHPIPEKPQLTDQQITAIKGRIAEGTPWAARDKNGVLEFYTSKPKLSHTKDYYSGNDCMNTDYKGNLYDFITFENSPVYLPELVEGSEEE